MGEISSTRAYSTRRRKSISDILVQSGRINQRLYHGESPGRGDARMRTVSAIANRYMANILRAQGNSNSTWGDYFRNTSGALTNSTATRRFGRSTYMR